MKKYIVFSTLVLLFFIATNMFAIDYGFKTGGGTLELFLPRISKVELQSELINIYLMKEYHTIDVKSYFRNDHSSKLLIGFPKWRSGALNALKNYNFIDLQVWYNNNSTKYQKYCNIFSNETLFRKIIYDRNNYPAAEIQGYYLLSINPKENFNIRTKYKSIYGSDRSVRYLLGTGKTWKSKIKEIIFTIHTSPDLWTYDLSFNHNVEFTIEELNNHKYKVSIFNTEPMHDQIFLIRTTEYPPWKVTLPSSVHPFEIRDNNKSLAKNYYHMLTQNQLDLLMSFLKSKKFLSMNTEVKPKMVNHFIDTSINCIKEHKNLKPKQ